MSRRSQVCREGSSPIEGPEDGNEPPRRPGQDVLLCHCDVSVKEPELCAGLQENCFSLGFFKTCSIWNLVEKCLSEAGLKNLQLYQELQGIWVSHLDLRKSEGMCTYVSGAREKLADHWCLIHFVHMLILTFHCTGHLDKAWITLWELI